MRSLTVLALALLATATLAQPAPADRWKTALEETSTLLASSKFAEARDRLESLTREMANGIAEPGDADRLFATALAQLAVAEAGAGDVDDAIWYWQIAQSVAADIRSYDLSPYAKAATEVLAANTLPPAPEACSRPATAAPTIVKRSEPKYPKRAKQVPVRGLVIVEMQLDAEGRPVRPQVLKSPSAALTYSTLMTLRDWRFAAPPTEAERATPFCRLFSFGHH